MDKLLPYVPMISATTALVAVLIGPAVTIYIARRQIRASTIAPSRQQWINTLREELANYVAALAIAGARSSHQSTSNTDHLDSIQSLCRLESKIRLLLNPKEADHAELIALLRKASACAWKDNVSDTSQIPEILAAFREDIISKSQAILKREWNRVKLLG